MTKTEAWDALIWITVFSMGLIMGFIQGVWF